MVKIVSLLPTLGFWRALSSWSSQNLQYKYDLHFIDKKLKCTEQKQR